MVPWIMVWKKHPLPPLPNINKIICHSYYLPNYKIKYFSYHINKDHNLLLGETLKWYRSKVEIYSLRLIITNTRTRNNIDTDIVYISNQYFYQ